ncbi:hypothetical protein OS493_000359 [Desmophyllum pertusum]|uniref:Rho termination factor N-terminal domain-containing protein n=1 Tax=Desmophyllum pertusum TaxID=174260 RepID=A0A9X0DE05_9CNID|nr:hypothetical protein OS493_000359 [Desmophyllum pertusum]
MNENNNFMMMSFTLPTKLNESVMSSKHNRTVAIINGPEKYETLKTSLSPFFHEVNQLISKGTLSIDGEEVELEFFLGGDMKFLLMILGHGVEKNNDDAKRILFQKSNKWDSAKDILCTESRQWDLKHHEHEKGTYTKESWHTGIMTSGKLGNKNGQKLGLLLFLKMTHQNPTPEEDYSHFTLKQLRDIVKEKGLNRKGLSKLKKQELIDLIEKS